MVVEAILHMYTHDNLWPEMKDLCALLNTQCNMIAGHSGGNPFDEACSCPWTTFADKFPSHQIPMACQSATIELRGEHDVSDAFASQDAINLYKFLVYRGFVKDDSVDNSALQALIDSYDVPATPLTGVDMIEVTLTRLLFLQ
jgi:uncharacterized protein